MESGQQPAQTGTEDGLNMPCQDASRGLLAHFSMCRLHRKEERIFERPAEDSGRAAEIVPGIVAAMVNGEAQSLQRKRSAY